MLEIILSQLYACEICLTQLTKSSYKQRVTHWESRFQAGLSSTCQSCGYIRSSILPIQSEFALEGYYTEKKKSWSTLIFSQRTELMYTYIQSKNWTARFHRNGIRHIHLFSQRTELLGSNETESDTYIQAKNWEEVSYPLYGDQSARHYCFSKQCYLAWGCNHIIVSTRKVSHKKRNIMW
jgi:hypothetical protein